MHNGVIKMATITEYLTFKDLSLTATTRGLDKDDNKIWEWKNLEMN